jgi:hypothetical protein
VHITLNAELHQNTNPIEIRLHITRVIRKIRNRLNAQKQNFQTLPNPPLTITKVPCAIHDHSPPITALQSGLLQELHQREEIAAIHKNTDNKTTPKLRREPKNIRTPPIRRDPTHPHDHKPKITKVTTKRREDCHNVKKNSSTKE